MRNDKASMRVLLDTHVLLWWLEDDPSLKKKIKSFLKDSNHTIFVSTATVWEISIKKSKGKLHVSDIYLEETNKSGFLFLPVSVEHASAVAYLPHHHKDPFDRLLIAQAKVENLTIISGDRHFKRYDVAVEW